MMLTLETYRDWNLNTVEAVPHLHQIVFACLLQQVQMAQRLNAHWTGRPTTWGLERYVRTHFVYLEINGTW